jgi:hypothetical protein
MVSLAACLLRSAAARASWPPPPQCAPRTCAALLLPPPWQPQPRQRLTPSPQALHLCGKSPAPLRRWHRWRQRRWRQRRACAFPPRGHALPARARRCARLCQRTLHLPRLRDHLSLECADVHLAIVPLQPALPDATPTPRSGMCLLMFTTHA